MPSSGAEDPVAVSMSPHLVAAAVAEPAPAPVHRRWTPSSAAVSSASSSSSPEHVDVAVQVPLADGGGPSTSRIELDDDGRTSSLDLVSSLQRSAHSTGQHGAAGRTSSLTPAESSPPPLSGARQRARRSPTLSDASSLDTVTAHSPPASTVRGLRPAAPDTRLVASNLPARPSRHPLHSLQLHAPPSRPPPRFILNPSFAPATVLGWVQGAAQKKRPPPRPPPRLRTAPPLAVAAPDVAPAVVVDDGQRRSGRAKTQAQLACAIYPPATERIAALAASTSASSSSSRSSSVSVEDPRARASAPLAAAKAVPRKHLMAQLRARYAFLAEDNCAPFRSDNLCDGINPEPCSFEWDDVEVRAAVRVEGWPRWKNADFEMKRDAGEAAELVLRAQAGDEIARDEVQAACRVTSWRYLDLDEALGCASNAATGWATRDWRMAQQQQRARGRGLDVVSVCEDPQAFLDALKEDAEPGFSQDRRPLDPSSSLSPLPPSPRKRGSTITDVPPSTPHAPAAVVDADELHDDPALDDVQGADAARRLVISDSDSDSSDDGFDDVRLVRPPHGSAARARARSTASAASSGSSRTNDLVVTPTRSAAATAPAASSTGSPTRSTAAAARRHASADASAESAAQVVVDESDAAEDSSSSSSNALDTSRATSASSAALGSTVTATRRPQDSSGSDERSTKAPRRQGRGDGAEVKRVKRSPKPRGKRRTTKRASTGKFIPRAPPARQASSSSSSEDDSSTSGPAKPLSPELVSPDTGVRHKKRSSIKQPAVAATRASSSSTSSASSEQAAPDPAPAPPSPPPAPSKPAQSSSSTPLKPGYKVRSAPLSSTSSVPSLTLSRSPAALRLARLPEPGLQVNGGDIGHAARRQLPRVVGRRHVAAPVPHDPPRAQRAGPVQLPVVPAQGQERDRRSLARLWAQGLPWAASRRGRPGIVVVSVERSRCVSLPPILILPLPPSFRELTLPHPYFAPTASL